MDGLAYFLENCKRLEYLRISKCDFEEFTPFAAFNALSPNLKYFHCDETFSYRRAMEVMKVDSIGIHGMFLAQRCFIDTSLLAQLNDFKK